MSTHDFDRYDGRQLSDDTASTVDGYGEAAATVNPLLEGLPARQALAIGLRHGLHDGGAGLSYRKIGAAMSISGPAAFYLVRKATRNLRRRAGQ